MPFAKAFDIITIPIPIPIPIPIQLIMAEGAK